VYERAIDVEPRNTVIWLKYAEMEMREKNVNLARNVWNRAVTILPRVDQFWYKFAYMEEMLGNLEGSREIFDRWMKWEPEEGVWYSYIKFEKRYKEWSRVRQIYSKLLSTHPSVENWIKWAEFEEERGAFEEARAIFERSLDMLDDSPDIEPRLFISFAKFETRQKEIDRARAIYHLGMEKFPPQLSPALQYSHAQFEREWGDSAAAIDSVILQKRRTLYASISEAEPFNYDNWFDWIRLEEELLEVNYSDFKEVKHDEETRFDSVREVFEKAIAMVPPSDIEKLHWTRYIYLWLYYSTFEEIIAQNQERALLVLKTAIKIVPHGTFTFTKLWRHLAEFHLRSGDLGSARKAFGQAIGMSTANGAKKPKASIFTRYIQMEIDLREFDRARALYERWLTLDPERSATWARYAELERLLLDDDRARGILDIACNQDCIDIPELVWKAAIDLEFESGELDRVRDLYERLLEKSHHHLKIWVSYANMEVATDPEHVQSGLPRARLILQRAYEHFKTSQANIERLVLLEAWKEIESEYGSAEDVEKIISRFPRRIKKRRKVALDSSEDSEYYWEEFYDYVFPDDESETSKAKGHLKLLEMAHKWKTANNPAASESK
jgi:crooked neck